MVLMGDVDLPHAAVREQVAAAIDLVVHIGRTPVGRRVLDVAEVGGVERGGLEVRSLVDQGRLVALPSRAPRSTGAGDPLPEWVEP